MTTTLTKPEHAIVHSSIAKSIDNKLDVVQAAQFAEKYLRTINKSVVADQFAVNNGKFFSDKNLEGIIELVNTIPNIARSYALTDEEKEKRTKTALDVITSRAARNDDNCYNYDLRVSNTDFITKILNTAAKSGYVTEAQIIGFSVIAGESRISGGSTTPVYTQDNKELLKNTATQAILSTKANSLILN